MNNISSYNIGISVDSLRSGFKSGMVPEGLREPFQSLLPHLTRAASESPTQVYLFSSDDIAETRNLFGYSLAAALMQHVPSTLLVDCGFMDVGMSGVVPERDALGFLDLLLYGSSLGVITQETSGGVRVVGAGSFPVTKKMPFVLNSFVEASRRLVSHSRCAIYCGPLHDDDGGFHPLIGAVDVAIMVRAIEGGSGMVDPIEEQVSAMCNDGLLSVRISPVDEPVKGVVDARADEALYTEPESAERTETEPAFEEIAPSADARQRLEPESLRSPVEPPAPTVESTGRAAGPADRPPGDATTPETRSPEARPPEARPPEAPLGEPPPREAPSREARPRAAEPPTVEFEEEFGRQGRGYKKHPSLIPKVATISVALLVAAFLFWWFNIERNGGGRDQAGMETSQTGGAGTGPAVGSQQVDNPVVVPDTVAGAVVPDTASAQVAVATGETQVPTPTRANEPPLDTTPVQSDTLPPVRAVGAAPIDSENIHVMEYLQNNWGGYFVIHVSSFRESAKARSEVAHLSGFGFPVFIVYIDLGAKGKWYRVYAGPLERREEARNLKKNLDDTPGVRFTRITQIPK